MDTSLSCHLLLPLTRLEGREQDIYSALVHLKVTLVLGVLFAGTNPLDAKDPPKGALFSRPILSRQGT